MLTGFVKRDRGTLINIGSVLSFFAIPISTSYSATKAHVMLFTIGLRDELTLPSVEDATLWANFDTARIKMFQASQTGKSASRYGIGK